MVGIRRKPKLVGRWQQRYGLSLSLLQQLILLWFYFVLHVLENNGSLWATVRVVAYPIHEFSQLNPSTTFQLTNTVTRTVTWQGLRAGMHKPPHYKRQNLWAHWFHAAYFQTISRCQVLFPTVRSITLASLANNHFYTYTVAAELS